MEHSVEYYLAKGLDQKMAEYFASGRKKIIKVEPLKSFELLLTFENGERRILDIKPLLKKNTVFEIFMDYKNFNRVYLDETNRVAWDIDPNIDSNKIWSNKVDLCPDLCYVDSKPVV